VSSLPPAGLRLPDALRVAEDDRQLAQ
jgi:hypothetical protein